MSQHDDDLAALKEYEDEARPPCTAMRLSTHGQCGLPARYIVELKHTHLPPGTLHKAFLCERCYSQIVDMGYPVRCGRCGREMSGPDEILGDPRKL